MRNILYILQTQRLFISTGKLPSCLLFPSHFKIKIRSPGSRRHLRCELNTCTTTFRSLNFHTINLDCTSCSRTNLEFDSWLESAGGMKVMLVADASCLFHPQHVNVFDQQAMDSQVQENKPLGGEVQDRRKPTDMQERKLAGVGTQERRVKEKRLSRENRTSASGAGKPPKQIIASSALPVLLDLNDFKSPFDFDDFFDQLVQEIFGGPQTTTPIAHGQKDSLSNGPGTAESEGPAKLIAGAAFPEAQPVLRVTIDAKGEIIGLGNRLNRRLDSLTKDVEAHQARCYDQFLQLLKALDVLFQCFTRLDRRVTGVAQTAARISDQLQHTDKQKDCAYETIDLMKYLAEFNVCSYKPSDGTSSVALNGSPATTKERNSTRLLGLSPIFTDDRKVAEAAVIVQKLRALAEGDKGGVAPTVDAQTGAADVSVGLEAAVAKLQDYCNDLENRLLAKFDVACLEHDLKSMANCAKILAQFNKGTSGMQRYVAALPMFMDVEVMNMDMRKVLGDESQGSSQLDPGKVAEGLSKFYKEILGTVKKEATTIAAVFPFPAAVNAILVQRILEQRLPVVLDRILVKPSLSSPVPMEKGGYLQYLKILSNSYESTLGLANELQKFCPDQLECEATATSLFSEHREDYPEFERASLKQLFEAKMEELAIAALPPSQGGVVALRSSRVSYASQMPVTVVSEFVKWNEDAVARCILLSTKPPLLSAHVRAVFSTFLEQVNKYVLQSLNKAQGVMQDAALLRERFAIGSGSSRRVAAAAATAAEAAAIAGESSFRAMMVNIQRATTIAGLVQAHFSRTIAPHLHHVDGFREGCIVEMSTALSSAEVAILKGLQSCVDTIMGEVERILAVEQKPTDFKPDEGQPPEQGATSACTRLCCVSFTRLVAYLTRIQDNVSNSLDGQNKQAFLNEVGHRLQKALIAHLQRCAFSPSGAFRVKRDLSEYKNFVKTLKSASADEKFELLGEMVNVLIVPPESLSALLDSSLKEVRKDALKFIELREDYKTSKIAKKLTAEQLRT